MRFMRDLSTWGFLATVVTFLSIAEAENFGMMSADYGTLRWVPGPGDGKVSDMCSVFYSIASISNRPMVATLKSIPTNGGCSLYSSQCGVDAIYLAHQYNQTHEGMTIPIDDTTFNIMCYTDCGNQQEHFEISWEPNITVSSQGPNDWDEGWTNTPEGSMQVTLDRPKRFKMLVPPADGRRVSLDIRSNAGSDGDWWSVPNDFHCIVVQIFRQGCRKVYENMYATTSTYTTIMQGNSTVMCLKCTNSGTSNPAPEITMRWERP